MWLAFDLLADALYLADTLFYRSRLMFLDE
jgi:hypothetical protein